MKVIPCRLYSGTMGWKVIDIETNKTLYTSESEIDCRQVQFGLMMTKTNAKIRK